ncbi:MAG: nucleotidyl transferase AbiEii/AbiGii toxin family protein [Nitrospirae bacterium]|nr:nucleotidyl transferase AbiEii/AbiGii toxin family protein [Nitrospirota bacterium]MBI4838415.1 nucleotidyl transferase AbiEii/AbiGii toxin family protein [Nitrospirota bacterium]
MSEKEQVQLPFAVLRDFVNWLKEAGVLGIVTGGVAASIIGRPRVTRDVDSVVIIDADFLNEFVNSGMKHGFIPRIEDVLAFAIKARVLLMKHKPTGIDVDISLGALPFEYESIDRTVWMDVGGFSIPLPTPEDLIIMKAVAHRPRDLADIESVLDANPGLDLQRIRSWVNEFSSVLEMPEISDDLEKILSRYP